METIKISKKDVIWSYVATFFQVASGLITLPFILNKLSAEEVGLNYLMITVGSLVALFDFGFAPQFGRNIAYVFSGAPELKKEGVVASSSEINYHLLATTIAVARRVYNRISLMVLTLMLTLGTVYIYRATDGFVSVANTPIIWVIYSLSTFFNLYYTYYSSLLIGKGLVMESKKAMLVSRLAGIALTLVFLYLGWGLLGVSLSNLIAPFISRYLSYRFFYTKEMTALLRNEEYTKEELSELFKIIWHNAKKLGVVFLGSYAINKFGMFLAGLFLPLAEVGSYGLMIHLFSVLTSVSLCFFQAENPEFSSLRLAGDNHVLFKKFSMTMIVYYLLFVIGSLTIVLLGPWLLQLIGASSKLPSALILSIYAIVVFLENNHSAFATFIVTGNSVPFVKPSLLTGAFIILFSWISLQFTQFGIIGLVLVQGFCQLVYNNWKWPYVVCRGFQTGFFSFIGMGLNECWMGIRHFIVTIFRGAPIK